MYIYNYNYCRINKLNPYIYIYYTIYILYNILYNIIQYIIYIFMSLYNYSVLYFIGRLTLVAQRPMKSLSSVCPSVHPSVHLSVRH